MHATDTDRATADTPRSAGLAPFTAASQPWPPHPTVAQERAWQAASHAPAPGSFEAPSRQHAALPTPQSVRSLAVWALVLGIVGLVVNPLAGVSIAALVVGIIAFNRREALVAAGYAVTGQGMIIAGLVLGAVGLASTAGFKGFLF